MPFIRFVLGMLILLADWMFTPKGVKRSPEAQAEVDQKMAGLSLYQYKACPFCVKVRRSLKSNSLDIKTYDAKRCEISRNELIDGTGKLKVPCLKIEESNGDVRWLFESSDIILFIEDRLNAVDAVAA
ncbi:MAG: glutaredoxin [Gammaproteobacteria bacterium]|nr:MAG: glutaredoxin [Gammaproteobacteria bacterium]